MLCCYKVILFSLILLLLKEAHSVLFYDGDILENIWLPYY